MNKKKSKLMLIAAIGAVLILIGAGVVRCVYQGISQTKENIESPGIDDSEQGDKEQTETADSVETTEPIADAQTARTVRGYYDTRWTANSGYNELIFLGDSFIEILGDQNLPVFYTLKGVTDDDGKLTLNVHAYYQTGDAGMDSTIVIDHSLQNPTITSEAFSYSHTYELMPAKSSAVRIDNLAEELLNYFDTLPDVLMAIVGDYAAENISDSDSFAWTGEIRTDPADESKLATFKGNDPGATIITVTRDKFGWFSVS